jgi:crotonobetainyl-CoA:carnitine CoA-transferase CaiB-like acyl-CoA transferase
LPLSGLRVADLSRVLAGPFCSMILADGLSWYFAEFNRNKRSLTLTLRHAEGREVLAKLITGGNVMVDNFRPAVLTSMDVDEVRLKALNPDFACGSVTGFGSSDSYRAPTQRHGS